MRISKPAIGFRLGCAALALLAGAVTSASAFDPEKTFKANEEPRTILRYGFQALQKGNMADAVGAFRFGAKKNDLASEWKLAHMLQNGDGVIRDDLAAYILYSKIVERVGDRLPPRSDMPYVSNAVVALGHYSLTGITDTAVSVDPQRAENYFYRAAALYKDREAQYQLGTMYRHGVLGIKQPRSAVRWLGLSARKGHPLAEAELGEMLFYGEGVSPRPVRGLVFLTRAAAKSAGGSLSVVLEKQRHALASASKSQRSAAQRILESINLASPTTQRGFALELQVPIAEAAKVAVSE